RRTSDHGQRLHRVLGALAEPRGQVADRRPRETGHAVPLRRRREHPAGRRTVGRLGRLGPDETHLHERAARSAESEEEKMKPIRPVENLFGAVWKSAVTETVARHEKKKSRGGGIESDHPMIAAADRYLDSLQKGHAIPPPKDNGELHDNDPEVAPYLMQLHHQLAHAKINDD